jgi:zinc protease
MKHLMNFRLLLVGISLLIVTGILQAQNTPIPNDSTILVGKLPNGLTYYIQKNGKPEKRVELRLVVNAGSIQEDDNQLGLAHFCEHMCFNGTSHFPKNDLIHYLQSVGVNFGPEINGYTSFDETVYMLTLPSDSAKILRNGFQIMADWANSVLFDTTEITKERGVVTEEWRIGRGAGQRMMEKYIPVILKDSKYAKRMPIGTKESIEGSSFEAIKKYYTDWYRPDLMAFVVVGDIDPIQVEQLIKDDFSTIPAAIIKREKEKNEIKDNQEPLISIVSDKENTYTSFLVAFKTPKIEVKTLDDFREKLTRDLFIGMLNNRLYEITKKANAPFTSANVGFGSFIGRSCMAFFASAGVKEDSVITGLNAVMTEIERVKRFGFTQPELDRKKSSFLAGNENAYNERDKRESGNLVWGPVSNFLTGDAMSEVTFIRNFVKEKFPTITLKDVNKWADAWIKDNNQVLLVKGVEKEGVKLPLEADLLNTMAATKSAKIEPYKEEKIAKKLMTKKPKAGKIISENTIGTQNITELKLSNGLKVILKPTNFKNDEIQMHAFSNAGYSLYGYDYRLSFSFATSIVTQGGVAQFPLIELNKMLAGKNVGVSPQMSDYNSGFSGYSSVVDLETMFQLIHLYFTQPRRDTVTYKAFVLQAKEQYKNALSNPNSYFYYELNKIRYRNCTEIPGAYPDEKDWNNLSIDKAFEVYKSCFSNASNFTFMFVGSFKPKVIKPFIKQYLGSLPTTNQEDNYVDRNIRPADGPITESVFKGSDPKSIVTLNLSAPTKWSKENSHLFWSLCNILQRVYTDKLREELSGVYGFGISGDVMKVPYENFYFSMNIPCAPENADKMVNAVYTEIERIKKEGPTAEEFKKEIESQRRTAETDLKENNWWMFCINRTVSLEKDWNRVEKPFALCEMLTPELLKETANKYLDTSKMVRVTLFPENFKKEASVK